MSAFSISTFQFFETVPYFVLLDFSGIAFQFSAGKKFKQLGTLFE